MNRCVRNKLAKYVCIIFSMRQQWSLFVLRLQHYFLLQACPLSGLVKLHYHLDTRRILNACKAFRRRRECFLNVLFLFNLCPVSRGVSESNFQNFFSVKNIAVLTVKSFRVTICECDLWFLFQICYSRQLFRQSICHQRTSSSKCRLNLFLFRF